MIKIKELKRLLEEAKNKYNKAFQDVPLNLDFHQYQEYFEPYTDKIEKLSQKVRLSEQDFTMKEISEYGDHMTLEEFKEYCEGGMFIDYDGSGNYATETKMSDISIYPSDVIDGVVRDDFTHVVWYNK